MDKAIENFGTENMGALKTGLLDDTRYANNESLLHDEIQAYLATSETGEIAEKFPLLVYWERSRLMSLFRGILNDFKREEKCAS